jgi:hypothetical protein
MTLSKRMMQGDLIALIEAKAVMPPEIRATLIPLLAALLLEVAAAENNSDDGEASDDEDRA